MKNRSDNIDRVLQVWMADGPAAIPDRVVDVVAARIGVQRQRRRWPFPRRTNVTTQIKLIAALAAALIVAVVGYNLLPGRTGPGQPTTAPTPGAQPTAAATAAIVDLPDGALAPGRYRIDLSFLDPGLSVVADIPRPWSGHPEFAAVTSPERNNSGITISFMEADGLFSDPCHWDLDGSGAIDQPGDVTVGPTVGDLVTALKANTSYTSSTPSSVTLGRFEGQELELQLPGDDVLTTCDQHGPSSPFDGPAYFVFSGKGAGWYAQGPDSRWHLYIVDVDGRRLITMVSIAEGTPEADIAAAKAIVESLEITP